ncbi:hypothetical protein [Clostridium sp. Marseille-P2415]|uniref:hypothetical protein n=1 Tax=Clostridium sp. Marseille-P2415 TaxID=1805471 RepID=UPI000988468D|nr:hypothetical protein [Clostridium sp. Marseille-P2415]
MRIGSYNSITVNQQFSKKKPSSVPVPDFFAKTAPKMSDVKFNEAIVQQAQKDASTGKFGVECPGFKSLMESYVSVVSPDRKGIIDKAMTTLNGINQSSVPQPEAISLLDILLGKRIMSASNEISYAEFKDGSGEIVATFSNGTWHAMGTPAEDARTSEFYGIYIEAWNAARGEITDPAVSGTSSGTIDVTT